MRFARIVNPQVNPNQAKRESWSNIANAVGSTTNEASSKYTVKTSKNKNGKEVKTYNYPYKVTAHDFGFNIPCNAYIKKITIGVKLRTSDKNGGTSYPAVGFYIADRKASVTDSKKNTTGWHNGIYWSLKENTMLTTTPTAKAYTMERSEFLKGKYTIADLNSSYFGVDLNFSEPDSAIKKNHTIYLMWVWCKIEFEIPEYRISESWQTSENNPLMINTGDENDVVFDISNLSVAHGGSQTFRLEIPWGVETLYVKGDGHDIPFDRNKPLIRDWTIDLPPNSHHQLWVHFKDFTVNKDCMKLYCLQSNNPCIPKPDVSKNFYFQSVRWKVDDYADSIISYESPYEPPRGLHKRDKGCFLITSHAVSFDNTMTYYVKNSKSFSLINIELDDLTSSGVSINEIIYPSGTVDKKVWESEGKSLYWKEIPANQEIAIKLNVPSINEEFDVGLRLCLVPHETGSQSITGRISELTPFSYLYDVLPSYKYHIGGTVNDVEDHDTPNYESHHLLGTDGVSFRNHRIATELTTGAFILPCKVKDGDAVMVQGRPNIRMYKWEELDYIGCVPLEHLHFDPKSTYKDKLLDNHYKNKRYMGKELASDEDITLSVRLHPHQVTTIQGLIDMDKPIPINANHRCFEGDALNHRGWAEIYGISTTLTNPNWYKCDIDVKYLTHNLNTRFKINRGDRTFNTFDIPYILSEINASGDALAQNQASDYFLVDTDGTYTYFEEDGSFEPLLDDDGVEVLYNGENTQFTIDEITYNGIDALYEFLETYHYTYQQPFIVGDPVLIWEDYSVDSNLRNVFNLDEGQHINIKSRENLSNVTKISFNWMSSRLSEFKENAISRIIKIVDEDGKSVFEYEYCDFEFDEALIDEKRTELGTYITSLNCHVIGRRREKGDYIEEINQDITVKVDVESGTIVDGEDVEPSIEFYGSTLHYYLNNGKLRVIDEGATGKEVDKADIVLEGTSYKYEVEILNKNTDGEDADIQTYIDVVVQDNILDAKYSELYSTLYVSPFPVNGKEIAFTRDAEEGVLYYLNDDKDEFSYLIEPYYQYHNGVDLRNESGSSIFNLNYGYSVIYLENGLVSLGINRLNGQMYLRKWDDMLKEYITLFNLHLNKFDDVNINSISDDRIELQASDTTIIMYRGHPYVIFRHETEEIGLDTTFHQVWGQKVDGVSSDYPLIFDLANTDNLLPVCVTSKLDDDCVTVSEEEAQSKTAFEMEVTLLSSNNEEVSTVKENDTLYISTTGVPTSGDIYYLIDGDEVGSSPVGTPFEYSFNVANKDHQIVAMFCGDDIYSYSISEAKTIQVIPNETPSPSPEPTPTPTPTPVADNYKLAINCPSKMIYRDGKPITFTLTNRGVPVPNVEIEIVDFNVINTGTTDAKGQVTIKNTRAGSHPKTYKIGARYWGSNSGNKPIVSSPFKSVTVSKGTAKIEKKQFAQKKGNYFIIHLTDNYGNKLVGEKVIINVNGTNYNRTTNANGNTNVKINDTGKKKYICTYAGTKDYKKASVTYRETVSK